LSCSAALVWLWHGRTEAHFSYFVMVGAIALYEAAWPYALAFAFVILQHGLMAEWMPGRVFGSMAAMKHAWVYAGIHGGFIAALALANLVSMRASARTRGAEQAAVMEALKSTRRFERAFASAPNGAALIDAHGRISDANRALAESLRATPEALAQMTWFDLLPESERTRAAEAWPPAEDAPEQERRVIRIDGTDGWLLCRHSRLVDHEGAPQWITQTVDVSRRRQAEEELAYHATHDTLTGLLNRRAFAEQAQLMLEASPGAIVTVLFVDVDDFKIVNDSLGHDAGDELLVAVTERLSSVTRHGDLLGRFGGDEFVLCINEPLGDGATGTARRINQAVSAPFMLAGVERVVTVSIGLATAEIGESSIDSLLRDADLAMYEAKAAGKAQYHWFDLSMRQKAIDRLELESDLREAVARGEIEAYFQPQVRASDGRVVGFEALARWNHRQRGMVPPDVFIPIAEHSGLVGEIGSQMLRTACEHAQEWARREPDLADLSISINASPRCICDEDLPGVIRDILLQTGVAPHRVCIEITESAVVGRDSRTKAVIDGLKAVGVRLAIDDFGVGHSSLAQLARLGPIDELKIDKAFIDDIAVSTTACRVVGAIISVATGDGLNVVAEGVEEISQRDALRQLGCPTIQGYIYSRPLPGEEFYEYTTKVLKASHLTAELVSRPGRRRVAPGHSRGPRVRS
jgi:diguanylate cyclase (GGDEF)-like protein/PAS domain S-box-containing protein